MKYFVERKEVWAQNVEIEANSSEEALKLVADGEGDVRDHEFVYSHTLEPDTWNVYEQKGVKNVNSQTTETLP